MESLGELLATIGCVCLLLFGGGALTYTFMTIPQENDIDTDIVDDTIYTVTYKDNGDIKTITGTIEETNHFTVITDVYGKTTKINNAFIISIIERE